MKTRQNVIGVILTIMVLGVVYLAFADDITIKTLAPKGAWVNSTVTGHTSDIYAPSTLPAPAGGNGKVGIGTSTPGHFLSICRPTEVGDASIGLGTVGVGAGQDVRFNLVTKDTNANGALGVTAEDANDKGWRIIACGDAYEPTPGNTALQNDLYIQRVNRVAGTSAVVFSIDFASDNVGIGMQNATAKLDIKGKTSDNTESALRVINSSGDVLLRVRNDGTVGIGIANPVSTLGTKLHVSGGHILLDNDKQINSLDTDGTTIRTLLQLKAGQTEVNYKGGGSFAITRAGTEKVVVNDAGNVGIGVTNPQRPLHISDVLRIQPRATAPTPASEGDIYVNSSNHHIYCYLGRAWRPLDYD